MRHTEPDEDYPTVSPAGKPSSPAALILGGFSVVIGVMALTFSLGLSMCCFILGWATVPFSAIGLTLGVVGVIVPVATKSRGLTLPIVGMSINGLALLVVLLGQMFGFVLFNRPGPMAPPSPDYEATGQAAPASRCDHRWRCESDRHQRRRVEGGRLAIHLKVQNVSQQRMVTFKSWNLGNDVAKLRWMDIDENEHPLELVETKANQTPETKFNRDFTVQETLTFKAPDDFIILKLDLPSANYGGTGKLRFAIPHDKVKAQ